MNEFVEECRKEWRRLRVPDAVANEMAADLEADLREAEADGASAEDVLGSSAFDPHAFAAAWATERGVVPPGHGVEELPQSPRRPIWRGGVFAALALSGLLALVGAALALHRSASAEAVAVPWRTPVLPSVPNLPLQIQAGRFPIAFGLLLLLVGLAGLALTILYWSGWRRPGGWHHSRDGGTPSGPSYS